MELKTQNQETINENIKVDDLIVLDSKNICKSYKNVQVLNNISIKIEKGNVYGLVGENGSGKTTFMRLITGLQNPTSGEYSLFNVNFNDKKIIQSRKKVAGIIEAPSFFPNFTAFDNLKFQATLLNVKTTDEELKSILTSVGLSDSTLDKKKVKNFSLCMKQRLGIAVALIGEPKLLMLDEPINGLDPAGIVEIRDLLLELNRRGVTIFISSHILGELTKLAGVYGVIANGKMVDQFTVSQLQTRLAKAVKIGCADSLGVIRVLENVLGTKNYKMTNGYVYLYDFTDNVPFVMKSLVDNNVIPTELSLTEDDPESYFLKLMEGGEK